MGGLGSPTSFRTKLDSGGPRLEILDHHWADGRAEDPVAGGAARFGKVRITKEN